MGNCLKINQNLENKTNNLALTTFDTPEYSLAHICKEGKVVNVYDGDTVHIVFITNGEFIKFNCRLLGIDSPEICPKNVKDQEKRNQEIASAIKSRNYLINKVTGLVPGESISKKEIKEMCGKARKLIWVKCHEFDKYGRLLVELYENKSDTVSINMEMVEKKYAVKYDGSTKKPFEIDIN